MKIINSIKKTVKLVFFILYKLNITSYEHSYEQEILQIIIKNKGDCGDIDCSYCPFNSYTCSNTRENYNRCLKLYKKLYGEKGLFELLL